MKSKMMSYNKSLFWCDNSAMTKAIFFAVLFALVFVVTGCGNIMQPTLSSQQQPAVQLQAQTQAELPKGTLSFSIASVGGAELARTVRPSATEAELTDIALSGSCNGNESDELDSCSWSTYSAMIESIASTPISLSPGNWVFTLAAKLNGIDFSGTCGTTDSPISVTSGANTPVSFSLSLVGNTVNYGGIDLTINYTGETAPTFIQAQLANMSGENVGSAVTLTPQTSATNQTFVRFTRDITSEDTSAGRISSGFYNIEIKFYAGTDAATVPENRILLQRYPAVISVKNGFVSKYSATINLNQLFTLSYNHDGGAFASGATAPGTYSIFSTSTSLPNSAKTGYTFGGWYTTSSFDSGTQVTSIPSRLSGNKTLYAKFTPITYTITFNNTTGATASGGGALNLPESYNIESAAVALPDIAKNGYDFGGWFENSGLTGDAKTSIATGSTENKEYWAKWTVHAYNITYNNTDGATAVGGGALSLTESYNIESAAITLPDIAKTGYTFGGWFDNESCTGTAETSIAAGSTGVREYWAKWIPNGNATPITISFTAVSTSGDISVTPDTVSESGVLILPAPEGYSDYSWTLDSTTITSTDTSDDAYIVDTRTLKVVISSLANGYHDVSLEAKDSSNNWHSWTSQYQKTGD